MLDHRELQRPPPLNDINETSPISLFLDFDGTLVEIAPTPDSIFVPARLSVALEALSVRLGNRMALISGRSLEDLAIYMGGSLKVAQAGSHGAARRMADGKPLGQPPESLPEEASAALTAFSAKNGLRYEAKTHGGALHFRENPQLEKIALQFGERVAARHGLAIKTGKCVVELVRKGADKGAAVRAFMEISPFNKTVPVFVGDDVTDEDGFAAAKDLGGFGILVGEARESRATYILASVEEVHQWLDL